MTTRVKKTNVRSVATRTLPQKAGQAKELHTKRAGRSSGRAKVFSVKHAVPGAVTTERGTLSTLSKYAGLFFLVCGAAFSAHALALLYVEEVELSLHNSPYTLPTSSFDAHEAAALILGSGTESRLSASSSTTIDFFRTTEVGSQVS